jgi:hypothetical protein
VTRDKLLLPLFEELGYGRPPTKGGIEAGGERFPITHRWGARAHPTYWARTPTLTGGTEGWRVPRGGAPTAWCSNTSTHRRKGLGVRRETAVRAASFRENRKPRKAVLCGVRSRECPGRGVYADFTALWLLFHQSAWRGKAEDLILEQWRTGGWRR